MTTPTAQRACVNCGTRAPQSDFDSADDCPECGGMIADIISEYTDETALDDGVLVAVTDRDRCTRGLFEDLARWLPSDQPPNRWPIDLLTWCSKVGDGHTRALSACKGLIGTNALAVSRADGDAVQRFFRTTGGPLITDMAEQQPPADEVNAWTVIWLLPNECGGITMMYPSDY